MRVDNGLEWMWLLHQGFKRSLAANTGKPYRSVDRAQRVLAKPRVRECRAAGNLHFTKRFFDPDPQRGRPCNTAP
jgi:hypothetical protein